MEAILAVAFRIHFTNMQRLATAYVVRSFRIRMAAGAATRKEEIEKGNISKWPNDFCFVFSSDVYVLIDKGENGRSNLQDICRSVQSLLIVFKQIFINLLFCELLLLARSKVSPD